MECEIFCYLKMFYSCSFSIIFEALPHSINNEIIQTSNNLYYIHLVLLSGMPKRSAVVLKNSTFSLPINYYVNFTNATVENNLKKAIDLIQNNTCITFNKSEMALQEAQEGITFNLAIYPKTFFGKNESKQLHVMNISIYHSSVNSILQDLGFALGMTLEIYRYDRDNYVTLVGENASLEYPAFSEDKYKDFLKNISYDIGSMYQFCSGLYSNGNVIEYIPKDSNYWDTFCLKKFSFNDFKALNNLYCNVTCEKKLTCRNSGYTNPKNCSECRCPPFYNGTTCEKLKNSNAKCTIPRKVNVTDDEKFVRLEEDGNKTCYFSLRAPKGFKLEVFVASKFSGEDVRPKLHHCNKKQSLEARYYKNKGATGALFCGPLTSHYIVSKGNVADFKYSGNHSEDGISILVRKVNASVEQADVIDARYNIDTNYTLDDSDYDYATPMTVNYTGTHVEV
uniref:Metalloendopeptidase n=1 Tax=Parastrongyloides trichosuri TaxID=131310 RepID=A0A0N5A6P3_PARTI